MRTVDLEHLAEEVRKALLTAEGEAVAHAARQILDVKSVKYLGDGIFSVEDAD